MLRQQNIGIIALKKDKKFLNIFITLPEDKFAIDLKYCHYQVKQLTPMKKSIYDPQFICMCLEKEMSMVDAGLGKHKSFYVQSYDFKLSPPPSLSLKNGSCNNNNSTIEQCQITWNFNRIHETEKIFLAYIELDERVGPQCCQLLYPTIWIEPVALLSIY